jgi:hypothetical protein
MFTTARDGEVPWSYRHLVQVLLQALETANQQGGNFTIRLLAKHYFREVTPPIDDKYGALLSDLLSHVDTGTRDQIVKTFRSK